MPKAKPPRYKAHARRVSPFAALTRRIAFGPNVQPPSNFWYPVQGSNVPLQLGAVGGVPQAGPAIIQSVSFLRLPREVRLMIYEHCDSQLIPSYQWLHARLSPSTKPGEKKWWTCDICGKEGRVCYCLRPALYTIHPALLDEVHDFVLRKNAFHLEPSAWFDLAKLHNPDRRRSMRVPAELQALWTQFMAGLRRVGVTMQWDSAYLAAVYKALFQSAHQVKELTLFAPIPHRENADWAAYTHFLSRLSGIRSLDTVRIVSRNYEGIELIKAARRVGCFVKRVCYICGEEMPLVCGSCPDHRPQRLPETPSSYVEDLSLDDGNIAWRGELAMLGCYVKKYKGYDLREYIP